MASSLWGRRRFRRISQATTLNSTLFSSSEAASGLPASRSSAKLLDLAKPASGRRVGRRAVSYILSVMVMALAVTALASVVLYWSMGQVTSAQSMYSSAISAEIDRVKERFVVEHVSFTPPTTVTIYLRNVGTVPVAIDSFYFNGTRIEISPPIQLAVGGSGSYTASTPSFSRGSVVEIVVSSQRGNTVGAYWKVK